MKKIILFILLIFSLSSCFINENMNHKINFQSTVIETKATFGDYVNNFQQIIWEEDDCIRICSDKAISDNGFHYADYKISRTGEIGKSSYGILNPADDNSLYWDINNQGKYNFYAVYPISAATALTEYNYSGKINGSIPNDAFMMVAHGNGNYNDSKINLQFYPCFNTFNFEIISDIPNITVKKLWIESNDYISGRFESNIDDIINKRGNISVNNAFKKVYSANENVELSILTYNSFLVFTLPVNINNIKLYCTFIKDNTEYTKSANINYQFTASKQYKMMIKLDTNTNINVLDLSDGVIEIVRCCSDIKYGYNLIRNMNIESIRNALLTDEKLQADFLDFINNTSILHSQTNLNTNITSDDFKVFKKLTKIEYMDMKNDSEIELIGLHISSLEFNHGIKYVIKDCADLKNIKLMNIDNNQNSIIEIDNCPNVEEINTSSVEWNAQNSHYVINNMSGLKKFEVHNANSIYFNNCPILETIFIDQASRLEEISLNNLPSFTLGTFNMVDKNLSINLKNVNQSTINLKGNGNIIECNKENSDVEVIFKDNSNNIKQSF